MQTRRSFIGSSLAASAIVFQFSPGVEAAQFELARLRKIIDATGKPTPEYLKVGIDGVEHVIAGEHCINKSLRCWLDGVEVSNRTGECDTKGGWVRMFDVDDEGRFILRNSDGVINRDASGNYMGRLSLDAHSVERIHFGDVRLEII